MRHSTQRVNDDASPSDSGPATPRPTDITPSEGGHNDYINTNNTTINGTDTRSTGVRTVDISESTCERYTSCRWTLAYMGSLMSLLIMCLRFCISMAIVCIGNIRYLEEVPAGGGDSCQGVHNFSVEGDAALVKGVKGNGSSVDWNVTTRTLVCTANYIPSDMQGVVLSSYYYGYILTPFLGGIFSERFGAKRVLSVAMILTATLTLLTPFAIRLNVYLTVVSRVLLGLVSGFCTPAMTSMWAYWAPKEEKAKLLTVTFSGSSTGSIMANLVSGFLCSVPIDEGWPFIFYTFGALALLWVILWQFLVYDTPEQHPRIQGKERVLIRRRRASDPNAGKISNPPMKSIFTSPAFLSLLITHISYSWVLGTISAYLPIYLNDVLKFDTQTNGILSSLPFVFRVVASAIFAVLSDRLTTGGTLTVTQSRKVFQSIGLIGPSVVFIGVGFLNPELKYVAVGLMIVLAILQSACMSGFRINHLDIAPRFAGSLAGITITFSTAANILSPLIISPMVADKRQESWRNVFIITAALSLVGALAFAIFGRGDEQDWAKEKPSSRKHSSNVTSLQNDVTAGEADYGQNTDMEIELEIPEDGNAFNEEQLNLAFTCETVESGEEQQKNTSVDT